VEVLPEVDLLALQLVHPGADRVRRVIGDDVSDQVLVAGLIVPDVDGRLAYGRWAARTPSISPARCGSRGPDW
jgi:hypothetical protein